MGVGVPPQFLTSLNGWMPVLHIGEGESPQLAFCTAIPE